MIAFVMDWLPGLAAWVSLLVVAGFATWRISRLAKIAYRSGKLSVSKIAPGLGMSILTLAVLLFALPYVANKLVPLTSPRAKFWMQTVAGNWSPDSFPPLSQNAPRPAESSPAESSLLASDTYEFAVSAAVAFWLNNAILFLLIGYIWRNSKMARELDVAAALMMRDSFARSAAKTLVRENFEPREQEKILEVFKEALERGQSDLEKHLPNIDERGPELLKMMSAATQRQAGAQHG